MSPLDCCDWLSAGRFCDSGACLVDSFGDLVESFPFAISPARAFDVVTDCGEDLIVSEMNIQFSVAICDLNKSRKAELCGFSCGELVNDFVIHVVGAVCGVCGER